MSFGPTETVKIVSEVAETGGFIIINREDFKEGVHKLYGAAETAVEAVGEIAGAVVEGLTEGAAAVVEGWGEKAPAAPPVEPQPVPVEGAAADAEKAPKGK